MFELEKIAKEGAVDTGSVTYGLLNNYQARTFLKQTFDSTPLLGAIRHVLRVEKSGEIDKIGIGRRLLRAKAENTDDGYRAKPTFGSVSYATKAVRLPWEITEETLRQNIEGENFEKIVTDLMTTQIGIDTEDLLINGDESTQSGATDYDFLKLDNGFRKQIISGGHVNDCTSEAAMSLDMFYETLQLMPNKYNNGRLRWLMSPFRAQQWELFLYNKIITAGGIVPESIYKSPASIPTIQVPNLDDSTIILTDPQNLIEVNTYNVKIRKDAASKDAIMQDKRFYVVHFDLDAVIEEIDATAVMTNIPDFLNA